MGTVIGARRRRFWDDNGFLVFQGFFDHDEIEAVTGAAGRAWAENRDDVVVDDLMTMRRCYLSDLSDEERLHNFKTNDLYLTDAVLRSVALSEKVGMVLEELLGDEPAMCNTLNFEKGSQQADHLDTLYMTPLSERGLVATWMALEDAQPGSGPLRYYPGSNQIAPYRFSTGSMHTVDAEMPRWSDYMAAQVERHGLAEETFPAEKGDLFIWHALLLHGGSAISDPGSTRRSLVTHYWTQGDCESRGLDMRPAPGGWWIKRPALAVPDQSPWTARPPAGEEVADFPATLSPPQRPDAELRERMEALEGALD